MWKWFITKGSPFSFGVRWYFPRSRSLLFRWSLRCLSQSCKISPSTMWRSSDCCYWWILLDKKVSFHPLHAESDLSLVSLSSLQQYVCLSADRLSSLNWMNKNHFDVGSTERNQQCFYVFIHRFLRISAHLLQRPGKLLSSLWHWEPDQSLQILVCQSFKRN